MEYLNEIIKLNKTIISCKQLKFKDLTALPAGENEMQYLQEHTTDLNPEILNFYKQLKSYNLKWESKIKLPEKIYGQVRIIESSKALSDWKEIVYFEEDSPLKYFKILDQFADEACCGFYTKQATVASPGLIYYYDFHAEPLSLQLTIEEYIIMLIEARGFLYWQRVLIDHLKAEESPHTGLMKEELNKVFPEFSFQSFIDKFNELRK
jgi:hypothetical protein